ncbi:hypothetical protein EMIT043CA1_60232 [Pseudomonas brassicacearum]
MGVLVNHLSQVHHSSCESFGEPPEPDLSQFPVGVLVNHLSQIYHSSLWEQGLPAMTTWQTTQDPTRTMPGSPAGDVHDAHRHPPQTPRTQSGPDRHHS